jgi:hypothetical protein
MEKTTAMWASGNDVHSQRRIGELLTSFVVPGVYDEEGYEPQVCLPWPGNSGSIISALKQGTSHDWPQEDYDALQSPTLKAIRTHQFIKSGWCYTWRLTNRQAFAGHAGYSDYTLGICSRY